MHQHQWFGPFPPSYKEITDKDNLDRLVDFMYLVSPKPFKPFQCLGEREISNEDKAFILKVMKLNPRDRPTVTELLQDEWFTERSERTVGWYAIDEWQRI